MTDTRKCTLPLAYCGRMAFPVQEYARVVSAILISDPQLLLYPTGRHLQLWNVRIVVDIDNISFIMS